MVPKINLLLGVEVADAAKMQTIMQNLEKHIETRLGQSMGNPAGTPGSTAPANPRFQEVGPMRVRALDSVMPGISPCYILKDDMLLASLNVESLQAGLQGAASAGDTLANDGLYRDMTRLAGTDKIYDYSVVDVPRIINQLVLPFALPLLNTQMPQVNPQQIGQMLVQTVAPIGRVAILDGDQSGIHVSYINVRMQPAPDVAPRTQP